MRKIYTDKKKNFFNHFLPIFSQLCSETSEVNLQKYSSANMTDQ